MLKIEVLGPGCSKCDDTFEKVQQVLGELKMEAELIKITDIFQIIDRGVNFTPALILNGKLIFQGRVPTKDQIKKVLQDQILITE